MNNNITNEKGLSESLYQALQHSDYNKGNCDFSATELIKPSRIVALERMFKGQLTEDASEMIYRMFGIIGHSIIDRTRKEILGENQEKRIEFISLILNDYINSKILLQNLPGEIEEAIKKADEISLFDNHKKIFEKRLFHEITVCLPNTNIEIKVVISGQIDNFDVLNKTLTDYKICSKWAISDGAKDEWIKQLNIYNWLIHHSLGNEVNKIYVEAILRDWSKIQSEKIPGYPKRQVEKVSIPIWDINTTTEYIVERCISHLSALLLNDEKTIELCSKEERWEKDTIYAIKKKDRKSAIKLLDSKEEAEDWITRNTKPKEALYVEERLGESIRCKHYCSVKNLCWFGRSLESNNELF